MRKRRPRVLMGLWCMALAWQQAEPAQACQCKPSGKSVEFALGDGVTLPKNARGVVVSFDPTPYGRWGAHIPSPENFQVEDLIGLQTVTHHIEFFWSSGERAGRPIKYTSSLIVAPDGGLQAGRRYRFSHTGQHDNSSVVISVSNIALRSETTQLQMSDVVNDLVALSADGPCETQMKTQHQTIRMRISENTARFMDVLSFETLVDGRPWGPKAYVCQYVPHGQSWIGKGVDEIYADCLRSNERISVQGLAAGKVHQVTMIAKLLGTDVAVTAGPVSVVLGCEDIPPATTNRRMQRKTQLNCGVGAGTSWFGFDGASRCFVLAIVAALATLVSRRCMR